MTARMPTANEALRVLLIEDSDDDGLLMVRELRRHGFEVAHQRVETRAGLSAALDDGSWDVVLADYSLPQFNASDALSMVQARGLDIPFILVSGTLGEERAVALMKAGANDFVLKSTLNRLGAAVVRELREAESRRQRRKAETALELLAEMGRLLTECSDYDEVLGGVVALTVPTVADWSILYVRGEREPTLRLAHLAEIDSDAVERLARRFQPKLDGQPRSTGSGPVAQALSTGTGVLQADEAASALARTDEDRALIDAVGLRSLIAVPLIAQDRAIGVWMVATVGKRSYGEDDLSLMRDIGSRIALVAENARLSRAREEFVSAAVHEIKTPIAAIKMSVQLLKELGPEQRERKFADYLPRLDRQCNRLTRLLTDVLEVSRLGIKQDSLNLRKVELSALVAGVVEEMQGGSGTRRFEVLANDAVNLEIDADRIEQVLMNLLDNAMKYSPGDDPIEISSRVDSDSVLLSVRDHGIGIPADKQSRVFERFYRAHAGTPYEHSTSLGVGLHLCQEFVHRHGGSMWFDSLEGTGTTFFVRLPLHRRPRRDSDSSGMVQVGGMQ